MVGPGISAFQASQRLHHRQRRARVLAVCSRHRAGSPCPAGIIGPGIHPRLCPSANSQPPLLDLGGAQECIGNQDLLLRRIDVCPNQQWNWVAIGSYVTGLANDNRSTVGGELLVHSSHVALEEPREYTYTGPLDEWLVLWRVRHEPLSGDWETTNPIFKVTRRIAAGVDLDQDVVLEQENCGERNGCRMQARRTGQHIDSKRRRGEHAESLHIWNLTRPSRRGGTAASRSWRGDRSGRFPECGHPKRSAHRSRPSPQSSARSDPWDLAAWSRLS